MDYQIYDPEITISTIIDPYDDPAGLLYVSNSSLAYFGGRYWAVMDGNTSAYVEGAAGQYIWMTTSTDLVEWTEAFQPFRDSDHCTNPIASSDQEWQPNLVVVGDELWCTWVGADAYVSKLASPQGKWTTYRFEFDEDQQVTMSSTITGAAGGGRSTRVTIGDVDDYLPFSAANPIILSTGRVCCPFTLYSATAVSEDTELTDNFLISLKFNALLTTTDGEEWSLVVIDTAAFGDFCAWEPFVVENPAGHVRVFSRSLNTLADDKDFLLVAVSSDGGQTFTASTSTGLLVPSSRGFARQVAPKRWVMTHVDHPQNSARGARLSDGRVNGALFMSRRGVDDFVPGVNFSGADRCMNYPQFIVSPDGDLLINYTSGTGGLSTRRSLELVTVPLPDDTAAYVHPRSVNEYNPPGANDPVLNDDTPPFYEFAGYDQALSVDTLTASTGVTYVAWIKDSGGSIIIDTRTGGGGYDPEAFGQVLHRGGLAINALNFLHGETLIAGPMFLAAVVDNTAQTVTAYAGTGSTSFTSTTGHYRSAAFSGQPSNGHTLSVDGTTYTFRTSASLANDVQIGATTADTIANLITALDGNAVLGVSPGSDIRVIMARDDRGTFTVTSGSAAITVESGIPLDGGTVSVGFKNTDVTTGLTPLSGKLYDARIYDSALTTANITNLHNTLASSLGYPNVTGTSTAPGGDPAFRYTPADPDDVVWPILNGDPAYCEIVSDSLLRIHGEGSASVELPFGANQLVIRYKLGAEPVDTDKYVIATFGNANGWARLYIDADNPTSLYCNGREVTSVTDPTGWNTLTLIVSTNKITIGDFEQVFAGSPRCYLGQAFPENLLDVDCHIDYDVSKMSVARA